MKRFRGKLFDFAGFIRRDLYFRYIAAYYEQNIKFMQSVGRFYEFHFSVIHILLNLLMDV